MDAKLTTNYYHLKIQANALIIDVIEVINQSIRENNPKQVPVSSLVLLFQEKFGFGESMLNKMLETYVKEGKIHLKDGILS